MNIRTLMNEYSIELNDVRYFLSSNLAFTLTELAAKEEDLIRYIESGELEVELYNMEEKYLENLQDLIDRDIIDAGYVREIFNQVEVLKRKRFK